MLNRIIHTLEKIGFGWLTPVIRLCAGQAPKEQLPLIAKGILVPILSVVLFCLVWAAAAPKVQTNIGTVPGPGEVFSQAGQLWEDHKEHRERRAQHAERQAELQLRFEERFPDREWTPRPFTGSPSYMDQIVVSLKTVFAGFLIASFVAIPIGILCGMSSTVYAGLNPIIQILKPVSPLAWLPIVMILVAALYNPANPMFERAFLSSAIVVALCSLWPTLINTAIGVSSVDKDHLNVAKVLKLGPATRIWKIILPSSLPYIFTGLRLSLGVGWMVLIAAEMLAQNPGLGKFIWDMYQSSSSSTLAYIMVAVITIGIIGFALDRLMLTLQNLVSFEEKPG